MNWLDELEDKVRAASEEIRRLRDENHDLTKRLESVEKTSESGGTDWQSERKAIRKRVEKIVNGLEKLVGD